MSARYVPILPSTNPRAANGQTGQAAKGRSKTGCLTCRKRRVKCDESEFPVCRRCRIGDRQCIPYDYYDKPTRASDEADHDDESRPRKKQRLESSPSLPTPPLSSHANSSSPAVEINSAFSPATFEPQIDGFLDPLLFGDMGSTASPAPLAPAATPLPALSPQPQTEPIHPTHEPVAATHPQQIQQHVSPYASSENVGPVPRPNLKPELAISDLYMISGKDPPTPRISAPLSAEVTDEIKYLYSQEYAKGVDLFLETTWYSTQGPEHLLADTELLSLFAGMIDLFAKTSSDNYDQMRKIPNTEAQVVWQLMNIVLKHQPSTDSLLQTIIDRLKLVEYLLTGRRLASNPIGPPTSNQPPATTAIRQETFWYCLGHFVTLDISATAPLSAFQEAETTLTRMRGVLDEMENRDVLYSMAIIRLLGPRVGDFERATNLPAESEGKFKIAKRFVEDEAMETGTNQVVQRLCGMAMRSWNGWR